MAGLPARRVRENALSEQSSGSKSKGKTPASFFVHLLRCADGTLYTGSTNDVRARLLTHNSGRGAKYTASRRPVDVVYAEEHTFSRATLPIVITEVRPRYSYEAMTRKVEGKVTLEALVLPNGSPAGIRVIGSLDPDLDEAAIAALERWRFKPATLNGQAVPVFVAAELTFTLK